MSKLVSIILLISYIGVFHHDEWFAMLGIEHHHDSTHHHHDSHDHGHHHHHHHGHSHDPPEEDDDPDKSIPLPDSHWLPIATLNGKAAFDAALAFEPRPEQIEHGEIEIPPAVFDRKRLRSATLNPPPDQESDLLSIYEASHLSHSVESNAPPHFVL